MLQAAIENEVIEYIQTHGDRRDENGQRLVVRNGHLPEREVETGVGPVRVRQPRVRHRDNGRFSSAILPKYMRRAPSIDALIAALYLKAISTGDFTEALEAILGEGASGLSATNIVRLKASWEEDYKAWSQRELSQKRYVYWWADGVYFNVRLDEERTCVLVLIGATEEGDKELIAVVDGYRKSSQSWRELLGQLKRLGLLTPPSETAHSDAGLRCRKNTEQSHSSVAGCTRRPISSIKCQRAFKQKPSSSSMKCTWRRPVKRLWQPTNSSFPVTRSNFRKPANLCKRTRKRYLLSMISRLSTGPTFEPPTRSNRPSPLFVCGPIVPKD
jgi:hypothetical protein